jgi:hypothetical protein
MPEKAKAMAAAAGTEATLASDISTTTSPAATATDEDAIAARAYSYWEARGCEGGSAEEDWYRAVEEIAREQSA